MKEETHSCGICKKQRHEILFKIKPSTLTSTIPFVNKKKDQKSSVYCLVGSMEQSQNDLLHFGSIFRTEGLHDPLLVHLP